MKISSVWKEVAPQLKFPKLHGDITVDVAIVGGGITGVTAAYLLQKAGLKVAVLEARHIGAGSTGFSTGNLYQTVGSQGIHSVKSKWNKDTVKEVLESRAEAVNLIEATTSLYAINCDFKRVPWCLFTSLDSQESYIKKERETLIDAGIKLSDKEIPLPFKATAAIRLDNQAQFNPYEYVTGLAKNIQGGNCSIYEDTKVLDVKDDDICKVTCENGVVTANHVIMATHTPKGIYKVHTSLGPYREYAVAATLRSGRLAAGTYWDLLEKEHYSIRTCDTPQGQLVMVLGETYKVGQKDHTQECFEKLEEFLRKHFDIDAVQYRWAAQQYKPADGIPYIGKTSSNDHVYIATGFAADGLTYGTLAAMIISDEIQGVKNKWADTYKASRLTPLASAKEFVRENINVLGQYLKDLPGLSDVKHFDDIVPGQGKVVSVDGEKLAAYRDTAKKLHVCSAVCTHMECIVNFNEAERTWDCPCHGSRFDIYGQVIEGPAIRPLPKKNINQ